MLIQDFLRAKTMMTSTPSRQGSGRKNIQKHRVWAVKLWLGGELLWLVEAVDP